MAVATPFDQTIETVFELTPAQKTALTYALIGITAGPLAIWAAIQTGDVGLFEECFEAAKCVAAAN